MPEDCARHQTWNNLHRSGPIKIRLKAAYAHYLKLECVFAQRGEAQVEIAIHKPDGSRHGKRLRTTLKCAAGERVLVTGFVQMLPN